MNGIYTRFNAVLRWDECIYTRFNAVSEMGLNAFTHGLMRF